MSKLIKIKFKLRGEEVEFEIPEADFPNFEKAYNATKVGGSSPKKAAPKKVAKKKEPKQD